MRSLRAWWLAGAALFASAAAAQERVTLPSLDRSAGQVVELPGFWFAAPRAPRAPAVVLLHGCGGTYGRKGQLSERTVEYARLLNEHGMHALVVDSLTPRGEKEICTQRVGTRRVTQANRRLDALAAVDWLAHRAEVDAQRIGLMGCRTAAAPCWRRSTRATTTWRRRPSRQRSRSRSIRAASPI